MPVQKLSISSIKRWTEQNLRKIPSSISCHCPFCGEKVVFSMTRDYYDPHRNCNVSSALCPSCDKRADFFTINPWVKNEGEERDPEGIYIYPTIQTFRNPKNYERYVPDSLQKAYESALNSYNSKNYIATAVGCRRTLEGIFHYLLSEEDRGKNLAQSIEKAKERVDWVAPLNSLAHMIRHGGNLGAHFDEEREPDEHVAKSMVELLEYLMEYLYELPKNIEGLQHNLENRNSTE